MSTSRQPADRLSPIATIGRAAIATQLGQRWAASPHVATRFQVDVVSCHVLTSCHVWLGLLRCPPVSWSGSGVRCPRWQGDSSYMAAVRREARAHGG